MVRQHHAGPKRRFSLLDPLVLLLLSSARSAAAASKDKTTALFTDPDTGISFQRFFGAKTSFSFGIALPTTPTDSFIGMLEFPLKSGAGWGGWSLTGDMEGPLLMAAWASTPSPNDASTAGGVISSFRQAFNEDDNPPEVSGSFVARPIAAGTSANATHLKYTFLCEGCLDASLGLGAADTAGTAEMGWALAGTAVRGAGKPDGVLGFHDVGFGDFDADLAGARFADFETWAAMAGAPMVASTSAKAIVPDGGDGGGGDDSGDDDSDDDDDDDD
ncbi:CBD9-like protein [Phialemonium atrogriseum]|uniref:CBD9-like protein n=1 Tax=Phialemonium atrogriseum TaxID=1093897 RepID=A0AAJ0C7C7_9PEZI|nr:CBD9-like protein [Phialemonium atrogriseum]KAK1769041.1 CBD9-like protein [Phialemonium atrogriseum]